MKIFLRDQSNKFDSHLRELMNKPTMLFDKSKLKEKTTQVEVITSKLFEQVDLGFFFDYKIFPTNIMTSLTQWRVEKRQIKTGDTIVQQVCIPPVSVFSQKIIFGVRITEMIDEVDKKGFSYETIEGHVERGVSTFTVEKVGGEVMFVIRTFSEPGNLLTRLLGPIFSIPYQTYCTRRALEHVKRQIELQK